MTPPHLMDALADWIVAQRWFAGKGTQPRLHSVGSISWPGEDDTRRQTHLVRDDGAEPVLYQVPMTLTRTARADLAHARIGLVSDAHGVAWHAYDGAHDPGFARRMLELAALGGARHGSRTRAEGRPAAPDGAAPPDPARLIPRVLDGEQSNTSIVFTADSPHHGVICKIFRTLHDGENPDVVLQSALCAAGSPYVPAGVGSIVGRWPDPAHPAGHAQGHLAFAQEFLPGARDAWVRALESAAGGVDFTAGACEMGVAVADVHATLAAALPCSLPSTSDIDAAVADWHDRFEAAVAQVPELDDLREPILTLYERARTSPWPRLQRIHGDLHLGQILDAPGRGWTLVDFEGEPLRPVSARSVADVPLRDVAGMLRSFDYAAGAHAELPGVRAWARACRDAFVDGYRRRIPGDGAWNQVLLDAFELDKALYETVYEARNRPDWLPIPTAAVHRLAHAATG